MRLFLDTSVLLAACRSAKGGSRFIVTAAGVNGWTLHYSRYVTREVSRNLPDLPPAARADWPGIESRLTLVEDTYVIDQPVVFDATKDRPVLLTAYKHSDVLLTLDRRDFLRTIGSRFYHLEILTPEQFIRRQRQHGIIKVP